MSINRRILHRFRIDAIILLCFIAPMACLHFWGISYKRGFFCNDTSLQNPFKESTVRTWMLYIIGLVLPVLIICTMEITKCRENGKELKKLHFQCLYINFQIPEWLLECYQKLGRFAVGIVLSKLITDIPKYSFGRLRPHFLAVCQPVMPDGSTCTDEINSGKYIETFTCQGIGYAVSKLKEVRLSFPSGHSSFTFYVMIYIVLYLQQSSSIRRFPRSLRHALQVLFTLIAIFTALSRVADFKHHLSDVIAGSTIGLITALLATYYAPKDWFNWHTIRPENNKNKIDQNNPN